MSKEFSKSSNVSMIPCTIYSGDFNFFFLWLRFLAPFHKLSDKDMTILSLLLTKRYELSKVIKDDNLLDQTLMSKSVKDDIREIAGMSDNHFQTILTKLRKRQIIENNKINKRYIPNLIEDSENYTLILNFDIKHDRE